MGFGIGWLEGVETVICRQKIREAILNYTFSELREEGKVRNMSTVREYIFFTVRFFKKRMCLARFDMRNPSNKEHCQTSVRF
jgi:hypothetical protein